jgi:hypothetical protein
MRMLAWVALAFGIPTAAWWTFFWAGLPVRRGEWKFFTGWIDDSSQETTPGRWNHVRRYSGEMHSRGHPLARCQSNHDGSRFVVLNLDHFGYPWDGGCLARRLRRLIDFAARSALVQVFPIPNAAWHRLTPRGSERREYNFRVVQRRGRECVFTRTHKSGGDPDYFLSGFDRNERPALYFLTQLPGPVESIRAAREALKPDSVLMALAGGRKVYRQGDMFAICTDLTTAEIRALGGTVEVLTAYAAAADRDAFALYGTAHTADYVATMPDGTMLAFGKMRHTPWLIGDNREPDHKPLKLKRGRWHLVAKNTTPMVKPVEPDQPFQSVVRRLAAGDQVAITYMPEGR